MVRIILAALAAVLGLAAAGLSITAISAAGTDEVAESEPLELEDGLQAVALNQQVVPYTGSTATLTVSGEQELFIGTADGVDTADYLTGIAHAEITDVSIPGELSARTIPGEPLGAPAASRDWWLESSTGTTVSHTFDLDGEPAVIVVAPAGDAGTLDGTTVTVSMDVSGVFAYALIGFGIAALLLGLSVFLLLRWWSGRLKPPPKGPVAGRRSRAQRMREAVGSRIDQGRSRLGGSRGGGSRADRSRGDGSRGAGSRGGAGASARRVVAAGAGRARRTLAAGAGASALMLGASGCAVLPIAQPQAPELTPYERPALREGEAGAFLTSYTEQLDTTLGDDQKALDRLQTGPLLDRTRAEVLIAEADEETLSAVSFSEVVAGSPMFDSYPMWFIAFGDPGEGDTVQAMVATRESATADWQVAQSLFVPRESVPTLLADAEGAVPEAPEAHADVAQAASDQLTGYLETGEMPESDMTFEYPTEAFSGFREYTEQFTDGDEAFDEAEVACAAYDEIPLSGMALETETGAVSFGEMRCTLTLTAPEDSSIDMGTAVEAVATNDGEGNVVQIDVSLPYMLTTGDESHSVVGSDWFLLSSQTSEG